MKETMLANTGDSSPTPTPSAGMPPNRREFLRRMANHFAPKPWRRKPDQLAKARLKKMPMKINLSFLGLKPRSHWQEQVKKEVGELEKVINVSTANVILEGRRESRPFFRIRALLAVPGPDYHAEGVDHTFAAALRKLVHELTRQIRQRKAKRLSRRQDLGRNWVAGGGTLRSCH